ncbi:unnamed protein product [Aspergillus oryzae]|uniref:DNA, SC003 n=4 Tax=Aspergillus oryzae TaxID=5062 RepID=Q2UIR5_ASPOR|nr:unnamed protein product [Aspergillus oryzae RIB40]EIT81963.1 hypothetical protein Ao3042_01508 [Aspergillus oryzae 3.042]KDE83216.1 hypothetical protein AO1008_09776 [Aspergillus oryzae 100-8]GMF74556.1 unnamed protein product [Aspergillus oryzae]GMG51117.1 unnamed protein product [Aspergillus oryzae var. brunneus]BAE58550.1 unnamed protein product [Aspergillus oryzae RIB40]|eukprot:EIT81963.1 hypothetical protein Ao3042_01508 [Aspergillus oryzae 3.042]
MRTIIVSLFVVVLASAIPAPIDLPNLLNPVSPASPASPASPVNQANPVNPVNPVKNPVGPKKVVPGTGFMVRTKRFIPGVSQLTCQLPAENIANLAKKCSTTKRICTSTEGKNNWTVECSTEVRTLLQLFIYHKVYVY